MQSQWCWQISSRAAVANCSWHFFSMQNVVSKNQNCVFLYPTQDNMALLNKHQSHEPKPNPSWPLANKSLTALEGATSDILKLKLVRLTHHGNMLAEQLLFMKPCSLNNRWMYIHPLQIPCNRPWHLDTASTINV